MKEIKRDYKESGLYEKLLGTEEFLEAFFNIFGWWVKI